MARIVRYHTPDGPLFGLVQAGVIHAYDGDIFAAAEFTAGHALMPLSDARLAPPVQPSKIVCVGRNYAAHAAERSADVPTEPMLFLKAPSSLIGHGATIVYRPEVGPVDHECELAVVIGRVARDVPRDGALDVVLGYTCANDVSARDYQKKDGQWGRAKGLDTFGPLGPWLVTELDPTDLSLQCFVNGELRQDGRTSQMIFDVPTLIAFISRAMTLFPGDVILTGTPAGIGPLVNGDVVRVAIDGIGALENTVRVLPA